MTFLMAKIVLRLGAALYGPANSFSGFLPAIASSLRRSAMLFRRDRLDISRIKRRKSTLAMAVDDSLDHVVDSVMPRYFA